jgi:hypothetical protein
LTVRRPLVAVPVFLLLLAGCGSGSGSLSAETVATGAEDALEKQVGERPDIECPEELPAEVGAETRCTLTAGTDPTTYGITVTVTSVEGDTANFDVEVDEQPQD